MKLSISARGFLGTEAIRADDLDSAGAPSSAKTGGVLRLASRGEYTVHGTVDENHVHATPRVIAHTQLLGAQTFEPNSSVRATKPFVPGFGVFRRLEIAMSRSRLRRIRKAQQYKTCSCCQRVFDARTWQALPMLGLQDNGRGGYLALKTCNCGTTLAMEAA